ncbi:MAG: hypothetical protein M0002_14260 [Rhodospirillales bacterium]|nr:hypothetical protein [Rhodospirillales bacterium]
METEKDQPGRPTSREVVGVFDRLEDLEEAVFDLETRGFDRSAFTVLGNEATVESRLGKRYQAVSEMADNPQAPRETFFGHVSRLEATYGPAVGLAAVGVLLLAGEGALPVLVAAAGGAAIGAAIGALIHRHEAERVGEQLARGGLLLWVNLRNLEQEKTAIEVLRSHRAHDVHAHDLRAS